MGISKKKIRKSIKVTTSEELQDTIELMNKQRKEKENIGGYFSLIWKRVDGKWVIISDHTS